MDVCLVCYKTTDQQSIIKCAECKLTVHLECYGCRTKIISQDWKCRYCNYTEKKGIDGAINNYCIKCRICNQDNVFGALKPCANDNGFAHLVCALLSPFVYVRNHCHYSPIFNIEKCNKLHHVLKQIYCNICGKSHASIKCRIKHCKMFYHPICLLSVHSSKCIIKQNVKINKTRSTMHYIYCPNHLHLHQVDNIFIFIIYIYIYIQKHYLFIFINKSHDSKSVIKNGREAIIIPQSFNDKGNDTKHHNMVSIQQGQDENKNEVKNVSFTNLNRENERKCAETDSKENDTERNINIFDSIFGNNDTEMSIDESRTHFNQSPSMNNDQLILDNISTSEFNSNDYLNRSAFGPFQAGYIDDDIY